MVCAVVLATELNEQAYIPHFQVLRGAAWSTKEAFACISFPPSTSSIKVPTECLEVEGGEQQSRALWDQTKIPTLVGTTQVGILRALG